MEITHYYITLGLAIPFGKVEKAAPVVENQLQLNQLQLLQKDSDNDGVIDSLDQCPDTMAKAKVDAVGYDIS